MLSRVIAKNVGDVFFETQCRSNSPIFPVATYQLATTLDTSANPTTQMKFTAQKLNNSY